MSNLSEKTILITGATSGIGRAGAISLAAGGARLIVLGRNSQKAEQLLTALSAVSKGKHIYIECDMLSMQNIREAASYVQGDLGISTIDTIISNAGSCFNKRQSTREGFERTFALNYLSYVQLVLQFKPLLESSGSPQIIFTTSYFHKGGYDCSDLQMEKKYSMYKAYAKSKLYLT